MTKKIIYNYASNIPYGFGLFSQLCICRDKILELNDINLIELLFKLCFDYY